MPYDFHIVYQPKPDFVVWGLTLRLAPTYRRRFLVSANRLPNYIGEENARIVLDIAAELTEDKKRRKFPKFGLVDIYLK